MEELNLVFKEIGGPYGDCMSSFDVALNRLCTVKELVDWVLKRGEWGYIGMKSSNSYDVFGSPNCEYRMDKIICGGFSEEYLERVVTKVSAHGGWSRMDYMLTMEEEVESDDEAAEEDKKDDALVLRYAMFDDKAIVVDFSGCGMDMMAMGFGDEFEIKVKDGMVFKVRKTSCL